MKKNQKKSSYYMGVGGMWYQQYAANNLNGYSILSYIHNKRAHFYLSQIGRKKKLTNKYTHTHTHTPIPFSLHPGYYAIDIRGWRDD